MALLIRIRLLLILLPCLLFALEPFVKDIGFHGNVNLSDKQLLEVMGTKKLSSHDSRLIRFIFGDPQRFSPPRLESDLSSIKSLYAANGFPDAEISASIASADTLGNDHLKHSIYINVFIKEGAKLFVRDIVYTGDSAEVMRKSLLKKLKLKKGEPFNPSDFAADRRTVSVQASDLGFPKSVVTVNTQRQGFNEETTTKTAQETKDEQEPLPEKGKQIGLELGNFFGSTTQEAER
jgi:outer membrane protein assembly factor BamA